MNGRFLGIENKKKPNKNDLSGFVPQAGLLSNQINEQRRKIKKVICLYYVLNLPFLKERKKKDSNMFCASARLYGEIIPIT